MLAACSGSSGRSSLPHSSQPRASSPASSPRPIPNPVGDIAFMSTRGGTDELFDMMPNGSHVQQITSDDADHLFPAWSPDGKYIAYVHVGGGLAAGNFDLHV